jgi:hypothetical protein
MPVTVARRACTCAGSTTVNVPLFGAMGGERFIWASKANASRLSESPTLSKITEVARMRHVGT